MNEIKIINNFDRYAISPEGCVISLNYANTGVSKPLKNKYDQDGYCFVGLVKDKKVYPLKVHRLVAEAFIPNPNNYAQVNHKNGIKNDNRVENLEWCTSYQNKCHGYSTGLYNNKGETNGQAKMSNEDILEIRRLHSNGVSYKIIMEKYGIKAHSHFYRIINYKNWRHIQ